jgi:4a-hydroxytetrahydrobiopterin dehydratase
MSSEVPDWTRDGNRSLRREFSFPDFRDAFGFVAKAALIAEAEGHHPTSSSAGAVRHFSSRPTPPPA